MQLVYCFAIVLLPVLDYDSCWLDGVNISKGYLFADEVLDLLEVLFMALCPSILVVFL